MGNGHHHSHRTCRSWSLAVSEASSRAAGIKYPNCPMANLLLGLLDKAGVHLDTFGDSTDRISLETQALSLG